VLLSVRLCKPLLKLLMLKKLLLPQVQNLHLEPRTLMVLLPKLHKASRVQTRNLIPTMRIVKLCSRPRRNQLMATEILMRKRPTRRRPTLTMTAISMTKSRKVWPMQKKTCLRNSLKMYLQFNLLPLIRQVLWVVSRVDRLPRSIYP
jgi:hypothetical protein